MKEVLADADKENVVLHLYVNPYGDLNWDALISGSDRLGFKPYLNRERLPEGEMGDQMFTGTLRRLPAKSFSD